MVLIPLDTLMGGLKAAHLDTGEAISPGQARRLTSQAKIIPVVLGGKSEVLDVGRARRFYTRAQRIALMVRDRGCTTDGCEWPPGMCHAHHDHPWALGGTPTSKTDGCSAPATTPEPTTPPSRMAKLPGGKVAFHRRP